MRKTIAEHMHDVLIEQEMNWFMWGDSYTLDLCCRRCKQADNLRKLHPLNRFQRVLNALERSNLFEKYYIELDTFQNNQKRRVRAFKLV